jgi:hypothetical protein
MGAFDKIIDNPMSASTYDSSNATGSSVSNEATSWINNSTATGSNGSAESSKYKSSIIGYTLNLDYNEKVGSYGSYLYKNFVTKFKEDISSALNIPINRIEVDSIKPGSVIVNFSFLPDATSSLTIQDITAAFIDAIRDTSSPIYSGSITRSTNSSVIPQTNVRLYSDSSSSSSSGSSSSGSSSSGLVTLAQLKDLVTRINVEITRLNSSGTVDPIVTQRVDTFNTIRLSVTEIIRKVESGEMNESDIPITRSSYDRFLPVMSNPNSQIPNILNSGGMSSTLNSLFPLYNSGDVGGTELVRSIFDKYAKNFLNNMSWDVNVRYTGNTEQEVAKNIANSIGKSVIGTSASTSSDTGNTYGQAPPTQYRGMFDSVVNNNRSTGTTGSVSSGSSNMKSGGTMVPAKLDWKTRSRQICEQITRRGLNQYDYGCMKDDKSVSETFSFRGYAKMICNRLSTNYDPGIPELCGCPPPTWDGWRG